MLRQPTQSEIAGDDRIVWQNTAKGVVATAVHPLFENKSAAYQLARIPEYILPGDRLRKIDYQEIYRAGVADTLTHASPPGKVFIFEVERKSANGESVEVSQPFVVNSYHLTFSFNQNGTFWRILLWLTGLGGFVVTLILLILTPLLKEKTTENRLLKRVIAVSLALFVLNFIRYLYLLIENDWTNYTFEKIFIVLFAALTLIYGIVYMAYEAGAHFYKHGLFSAILGTMVVTCIFAIVFPLKCLKLYHAWVESIVCFFFFIHVLMANLFALLLRKNTSARQRAVEMVMSIVFIGLLIFQVVDWVKNGNYGSNENLMFAFSLSLFYPVFNAAGLRLRFGKVSVVLSQTIQYVIFFVVSLICYLLASQVFDRILTGNTYKEILSVITAIVLVMLARSFFLSNEKRIRNYFILSQQEREEKLKAFIARIPQYSSPLQLQKDSLKELEMYLQPKSLYFWWHGDVLLAEESANEVEYSEIHQALQSKQLFWAKNKELSGLYLPEKLEAFALQNNLMFHFDIDEKNYGLLVVGPKQRGVYNLEEVEKIGQVLQQMHLTINVLQLVGREKELMEQTYQANLTALRAQINPHFLFNTLNTISALIHDSPDLAEQATEKLAFIFRYTLKVAGQNLVPLAKEIELVSAYLEIEKIRFGKRLVVDIEVEEEAEQVEIPAFVIQTLIENCIKHGIAKIVEKGEVSISAYIENDYLICEVFDNGPGIQEERIKKGTGLNNVITRMENIYGATDTIVFKNVGKGTLVTIRVPVTLTPSST